jgi:hypothetical protein
MDRKYLRSTTSGTRAEPNLDFDLTLSTSRNLVTQDLTIPIGSNFNYANQYSTSPSSPSSSSFLSGSPTSLSSSRDSNNGVGGSGTGGDGAGKMGTAFASKSADRHETSMIQSKGISKAAAIGPIPTNYHQFTSSTSAFSTSSVSSASSPLLLASIPANATATKTCSPHHGAALPHRKHSFDAWEGYNDSISLLDNRVNDEKTACDEVLRYFLREVFPCLRVAAHTYDHRSSSSNSSNNNSSGGEERFDEEPSSSSSSAAPSPSPSLGVPRTTAAADDEQQVPSDDTTAHSKCNSTSLLQSIQHLFVDFTPEDQVQYFDCLDQLTRIITNIINTSCAELRTIGCGTFLREIQAVQQRWRPGWPGSKVCTRILLSLSRLSRLLSLLV